MKTFEQAIAAFEPPLPLAVAFSGGADSTALLVACARRWPAQVTAVHINHQLQPAAAGFEAHCARVCADWGVPLVVQRVDAQAQPGQSPEDAARAARYKALGQIHEEGRPRAAFKSIALAQHLDDQIETLLIALGRGAGLPGLAGMGESFERHGVPFLRPLLDVNATDIRRWLREQGLPFVEDPSNADARFTRNRLRAQALPGLRAALPALGETLPRSLRHIQEAAALLDEVAAADLQACLGQGGGPQAGPQLALLQPLSRARQANLLRHWLKSQYAAIPSAAQLAELQDQVAACTTRGHRIHLKVADGFVLREGGALIWRHQATGPHAAT